MRFKLEDIGDILLEAKDKEGKEWDVVLIQAGLSKNGKYYPADVLKKSLSLFEGAKAYVFEFKDGLMKHLPELARKIVPQGFLRNLVGWYDEVRYGEFRDTDGNEQEGIIARFHISEAADWLRKLMRDAWDAGKQMLGFSIDGGGKTHQTVVNGQTVEWVDEISVINSTDVVSYPAAGGQALRLVAGQIGGSEMKKCLKMILDFLAERKAEILEGLDLENLANDQLEKLVVEALKEQDTFIEAMSGVVEAQDLFNLLDELAGLVKNEALELVKEIQGRLRKYGYPGNGVRYGYPYHPRPHRAALSPEEKERLERAIKAVDSVKEELATEKRKTLLASTLMASNLPVAVKDKLRKTFSGRAFEEKELTEALVAEKETLAKLSESGEIKGLGISSAEIILDEADKKQSALDKLVDPEAQVSEKCKGIGAFRGLKEAYVAFTGDGEVTGRVPEGRLAEAMSTTDFAYALGASMTRRLVKLYGVLPSTWRNIANIVPVSDFKTQEAIRWGGFGRLPVVAERAAYGDLFGASDERATYSATKKGGYVSITREMIKNDDLKMLARIPKELARAANETVEYYAWNPLIANSNIYDGTALATVAHANYATDALGFDALTAAKSRMRKQWNRGSKEDSGSALGTHSATTLQDTTKSWVVNQWTGRYARLVSGAGAGAIALIASNSADTLTFATVPTAPVDGTKYEISVAAAADPRIGLEPKFLVCGIDLKPTAEILRNSDKKPLVGAEEAVNIHKGTFDILTPLWWADLTDWALLADKNIIDMVEIGFVDGAEEPQLLVQDVPTIGNVFTNDEIRYRVRHEYGLAIVDYRGFTKNVVGG